MGVKQLLDLSGRTALVTGGSRGLGLQIGEALAEMGARVALVARKRDELDAAVAHLATTQNSDAVPFVCDLSDPVAIAPMVARAEAALGPIDILVNNAGATWGAATIELPLAAWQKVIDLNLTAMFLVTQEVGRRSMVPRRQGKVINVASVLGLGGGSSDEPAAGHARLQHEQGWRREFHAGARRRVGATQHQRQRDRAGILPDQNDEGDSRNDGR